MSLIQLIKVQVYIVCALLPVFIQAQKNEDRQPEKCLEIFQYTTNALYEHLYTAGDSLFQIYSDSLDNRTVEFRELLEAICREDSCISYNYTFRQDPPPIKVITSADRKIRLFTRNTRLGGSMPDFETFIQYRTENNYYVENVSAMWQDIPTLWFDTIQIIHGKEHPFYLLSGSTQLAGLYPYFLIMAIRIEGEKIVRQPLFVTGKEKTDHLSIAYRSYNHELPDLLFADGHYPRIVYDSGNFTLYVPHVQEEPAETDDGYLNGTIDIYKWNPELQRLQKDTERTY